MPLYDYLLTHPYGSIGDTPVESPVSYFWRPDFTSTALLASGLPTVGLALGSRCDCLFNNVLVEFFLRPGAADGGDPGQVAPDDYNALTNNVHWEQMGGG